MDQLLSAGQAISLPAECCLFGALFSYRKTAAIQHQPTQIIPVTQRVETENLLSFEPESSTTITSRTSASNHIQSVAPLDSIVVSTDDTILSRLAAAALSLSTRLRNFSRTAYEDPRDINLETCPVCSLSFRKYDDGKRRIHIEECISKTEKSGSVLGDRYSIHRWSEISQSTRECSICYEDFLAGQHIAVLNCLCQFHQQCIDSWLERGKYCPYHNKIAG